jgi:arylsulfatase A
VRWWVLCVFIAGCVPSASPPTQESAQRSPAKPPNIIFILSDDLGYGELGVYGQKKIRTPRIDRMAREGVRFSNFYCGSTVCAPSRCSLMTGKHNGHAWVRDNQTVKPEGQVPLPETSVTIAKVLKGQGYATGATGKWGLGGTGTQGDPNRQGFDLFFGYICQGHAHNYYPTFLYRNGQQIQLESNDGTWTGRQYSHDLVEKEALDFIRAHQDHPFFLYVPFTIPHVSMQVPADSLAEYKDLWDDPPYDGSRGYLPHPKPRAAHAAMITRMDRSVGRILDLVAQLGLDQNTLVMFSSDNGSIDLVGGHDLKFFEANGPLRDGKGLLYEGGIRIPFIARWPGRIRPGAVCEFPGAFYDLLPTFAELAGARVPADLDGVSLAPTLLGQGDQKLHDFFYWEIPSGGGQQAVRMGDWKGYRGGLAKEPTPLELYDLRSDLGERENVAAQHPQVVSRILSIMDREHVPSELFPLKAIDGAK